MILNGIVKGYVRWIYHGEYNPPEKQSRIEKDQAEIFKMIFEAQGSGDVLDQDLDNIPYDGLVEELDNQPEDAPFVNEHAKNTKGVEAFQNLMKDAQ